MVGVMVVVWSGVMVKVWSGVMVEGGSAVSMHILENILTCFLHPIHGDVTSFDTQGGGGDITNYAHTCRGVLCLLLFPLLVCKEIHVVVHINNCLNCCNF